MKIELLLVATFIALGQAALTTLPNIGYLGKGYDLFRGCPRPFTTPIDPGYSAPVFDVSKFTQNRTTADLRYIIPDNSAVLECAACQMSMDVKVSQTIDEYRESLNDMVNWGFSFSTIKEDEKKEKSLLLRLRRAGEEPAKSKVPPMKMSFSSSKEMNHTKEILSTSKDVLTEGFATCATYCADLELYSTPGSTALTQNFINAVASLSTQSEESFYGMMLTFGTHFVGSMKMGSLFWQRNVFSQKEWKSLTEDSKKTGKNFEAQVAVVGGHFNKDHQESQYQYSNATSKSESTREFTMGAPPAADVKEWLKETSNSPMPYIIGTQPISVLLSNTYFPKDTEIGAKRVMFERLIADGSYCNYLLKMRGEPNADCSKYYSR